MVANKQSALKARERRKRSSDHNQKDKRNLRGSRPG